MTAFHVHEALGLAHRLIVLLNFQSLRPLTPQTPSHLQSPGLCSHSKTCTGFAYPLNTQTCIPL